MADKANDPMQKSKELTGDEYLHPIDFVFLFKF